MNIPIISMPPPSDYNMWQEIEPEFACDSVLFPTPLQDKIADILSNDPLRQHNGCLLLAEQMLINFSVSPEFQSETLMNDIIESQIIPSLISLCLHHQPEKVRNAAFFVIASITSHSETDKHVLQTIMDNGCIESIIEYLSLSSQSSNNERMTHSALSILSHLSRAFRDDVLSKDTLPIIIALLFREIPSDLLCKPAIVTPLCYGYEPDSRIKYARLISAILSNLCCGDHANDADYLVDIFEALQYLIQSEDFEILRNTLRGLQQLVSLKDTHYLDPAHRASVDIIMNHHNLLFNGFITENIKSLQIEPSNDLVNIISNYHSKFVCFINDDIVIPRLCKLLCHKNKEIKLLSMNILIKVITGNTKKYLVNELIHKYNLIECIGNVLKINYPESSNVIMSGITDVFLNVFVKCINNKSTVSQLSDLLVTASQTNPQINCMVNSIMSDQTILKSMIKSEIVSKLLKGIAASEIDQQKDTKILKQLMIH